MLENAAPGVQSPRLADGLQSDYWNANEEKDLQDHSVMFHLDVLKMARQHRNFTTEMAKRLPKYVPPRDAEPQGIVTVAGGDYFPGMLVSLRMLRRTGCTLPVEVWMADESEYEPEICEEVLPAYNARCRLLSDIFNPSNTTVTAFLPPARPTQRISRYQYKIFAILFSSFRTLLFLDSDNIALADLTPLFTSTPFTSTGLVTWPDLWATSISPIYYLIADQPAPPSSLRASTESGQLLINKHTHHTTLLLAAYYNYYGPEHYYLLLCQGGYGRGDKSTFVPAALAMNASFYDVAERPVAIGQEQEWMHVHALLQFDAIADYNLTSHGLFRNRDGSVADAIPPLFLHANDPKWNAERIFHSDGDNEGEPDLSKHGFFSNPTRLPDGSKSWIYKDPPDVIDRFGVRALEKQLWEETRWVSCEVSGRLRIWKGKEWVCERVEAWVGEFVDTDEAAGEAGEERMREDKFGRIAALAAAAAAAGAEELPDFGT